MHARFLRAAALALSLLSPSGWLHAAAPTERELVIDEALAQIKENFVFPERYQAIEQSIRAHQARGDYAAPGSEEGFASLLTTHLQEVSHDKHLYLQYQPNVRSLRPAAFVSTAAKREQERRDNYGFHKVEILKGNVGYIDLIYFHDDTQTTGEIVAGAMAFLANTDALIIDLRNMRGGSTTMALMASYLLEPGDPIMELRYRDGKVLHTNADYYVPGRRYLGKPVYLLTSSRTFSAGEAFAYALQSMKRATLVGVTTRGGGNPNMKQPIRQDYLLSVPIGQSVSPVTGGSWEGVGVKPDIAAEEAAALDVAHRHALQALREAAKDEGLRATLGKEIASLGKD